jgi:hypothetical protein
MGTERDFRAAAINSPSAANASMQTRTVRFMNRVFT